MDTDHTQILNEVEVKNIVRKSLKLINNDSISLLRYSVTRGSSELVGFMGEYFKLNVYLKAKIGEIAEQHLSYFVKSVPISNEFHRDECQRKGFFPKETRIYAEILPNIQRFAPTKLFPECYYTRKDLIVLEDLSTSAEGLRHIEPNEELTMKHHRVVLKHLAKLHAASLAWERADNINIGERFRDVLFEMQLTLANEWYVTGIKGIIFLAKMHEKFQAPDVKHFIDTKLYTILSNVGCLTDPSKKWRNVLCHRDTWDRNIFFKYNAAGSPIDCRIVDFQLTRYNVPGTDVLFFLYVTTSPARRRELQAEFFDFYYECLADSMKALNLPEDLITKADFLAGCKRARLAALILWAICEPLMKMPEGLSNKMRAEEAEKFDFYMNTQRDEMFVRIMAMDPGYKDIIMTPIEELVEYLLDNEDICAEFLMQ